MNIRYSFITDPLAQGTMKLSAIRSLIQGDRLTVFSVYP
jgi:hypothetical protein